METLPTPPQSEDNAASRFAETELRETLSRVRSRSSVDLNDKSFVARRDAKEFLEAAIFFREGRYNSPFEYHPKSEESQMLYMYLASSRSMTIEAVVGVLFLGLTFFEEPAVYLLPVAVTGSLHLVFCAFYAFTVYLKAKCAGGLWNYLFPTILPWGSSATRAVLSPGLLLLNQEKERSNTNSPAQEEKIMWTKSASWRWTSIFTIIALVLTFLGGFLAIFVGGSTRLFYLLRPLVILDTHAMGGVRRVLRQVLKTFNHTKYLLLLQLGVTYSFSVIAFILYERTGNSFFGSLRQSFISLVVLFTTTNYPDVMMKSFDENRATPVFFVIYLILSLYMIQSTFVGMISGYYQQMEIEKRKKIYLHQRRAVRYAYDIALRSQEGGLTLRAFTEILRLYDPSKSLKDIILSFYHLDVSRDNLIWKEEAYRFYEVSNIHWTVDYGKTLSHDYRYLPTLGVAKWRLQLRSFALSKFFVYLDVLVAVGSFIFISIEESNYRKYSEDRHMHRMQWFFFAYLLGEVFGKLASFGWREYFGSILGRFDFFCASVLVLFFFLEEVGEVYNPVLFPALVRGFMLFRIFRVFKPFREIFGLFCTLAPILYKFLMAMLFIYYIFAEIGMQTLSYATDSCDNAKCGNAPYYGNPEKGEDSIYFQLNNFNNVLFSYNTLFHLTVTNNWWVTMDGFANAIGETSRIFFISFFFVGVCFMTNVIVSFYLSSFQALYTLRAKKAGIFKRHTYEVAIPSNLARQFLPKDDLALLKDTVYFVGSRNTVSVFNLIYDDMIRVWTKEDEDTLRVNNLPPVPKGPSKGNVLAPVCEEEREAGDGPVCEDLDEARDVLPDAMLVNDAGSVTLAEAVKMMHLTPHERAVLDNVRKRISEARNVGISDNDCLSPSASSVALFALASPYDSEHLTGHISLV